uniref:Proline--tRNA ligase n=1 Tax=Talaromyces marneffei PM1 TaxID=1077442 RepID=A0A093UY48_TALMA
MSRTFVTSVPLSWNCRLEGGARTYEPDHADSPTVEGICCHPHQTRAFLNSDNQWTPSQVLPTLCESESVVLPDSVSAPYSSAIFNAKITQLATDQACPGYNSAKLLGYNLLRSTTAVWTPPAICMLAWKPMLVTVSRGVRMPRV